MISTGPSVVRMASSWLALALLSCVSVVRATCAPFDLPWVEPKGLASLPPVSTLPARWISLRSFQAT